MSTKLDIAHLSDTGRSYSINCDRTVAIGPEGLHGGADAFLLVADGMGANRKGDTASRLTAEKLPELFVQELAALQKPLSDEDVLAALRKAAQATNELVWRTSQETPDLKGMGTTVVAAVVRGSTILGCHAGDSRAYLLTNGELVQLTADHSMIQEVVGAPDPNLVLEARFGTVITRGIGLGRTLDADTIKATLGSKDALLLCTDGLSNLVPDETIAATIAEAPDAATACERLIEKANEAGGLDNIGVVVCRGGEFEPYTIAPSATPVKNAVPTSSQRSSSRRRSRKANGLYVILLVLSVLLNLALAAVTWWAMSEKGRVEKENATIKKQFLDYVERAERRKRPGGM